MFRNFLFSVFACLLVIQPTSARDSWESNHLLGTGRDPMPYMLEPFLPTFEHLKPVDLEFVPASEEIAVVELVSKIYAFSKNSTVRRLVADFRILKDDGKTPDGTTQLYNLEFAPDFPKDPRAWLIASHRAGPFAENILWQLSATLEDGKLTIDPENKVELLRWQSTGHNGADLKFSPHDGFLYISTGDGEAPADPANVGQKTDNLLGSILRIDVSDPKNPIQIPDDNPFLSEKEVPDEVWAYGLRNPWRMSFHPESHELFLGDNGDENWELVRRVTRATNHGWSVFEGSVPFRLTNKLEGPVQKLTVPIYEHPHTEMRSVIGGFFYRGKALPELVGHYVYGCYFTGKIWALEWDGETATNVRRIADLGGPLVSFAEDRDHELIVIDHQGPVFRLIKNPAPPSEKPIPATLSETGIFSNTSELSPAEGVVPYEIAAPAWQDGAKVTRHFGIAFQKEKDVIEVRIGDRQNKSWRFPNGSAFAQTIAFNGKKAETRIMHKDGGEWQFFTYQWRDDQTDADLVPPEGISNVPCSFDEQTLLDRRIPARAECTACHTQRSFFVMGLNTPQLNIPVERDGKTVNQLDWLVSTRPDWFRPHEVNAKWERPAAYPDPYDPTADLDKRARTYLHVNCAHCHRESGLGGRAQFELLEWLSLDETGCINSDPLVGLPGAENTKILAPGAPERSAILQRMSIRGAAQMPLLDSVRVDEKGIALVREWISNMSKN